MMSNEIQGLKSYGIRELVKTLMVVRSALSQTGLFVLSRLLWHLSSPYLQLYCTNGALASAFRYELRHGMPSY